MSVKTEIEWFGPNIEPKNGSMVLINTDIINAFEDIGVEDDFEIETKSFPAVVYDNGRGEVVFDTWYGETDETCTIPLDDVCKWAYMPTFKK